MSDATAPGDREATAVGFLRHGADVLLVRRRQRERAAGGSAEEGTGGPADATTDADAGEPAAGPWDAIRAAAGDDPGAAMGRAVESVAAPDATVAFVRRGEPFRVETGGDGRRVHPYLFEHDGDRAVAGETDAATSEWVQPTAALDRETAPGLWTAWRRVAPTVGTVRADAEHGASYLSLRALEVLRDRAAALAAGGDADDRAEGDAGADEDAGDLTGLAAALADARPGMAVVATRIDRVMAETGAEPAAVRERAEAVLAAAVAADGEAARAAADRLRGIADAPTVLTLSRSGTVRRALAAAGPAAVLVAESRPGGEGAGVAETLAETGEASVTLFADAAVAHVLGTRDVDAVLVGADAVHPDGTVVNKVGTRAAACAAAREGVPVYAVCSRDKVRPEPPADGPELAPRDPGELYGGDAPVAVENPTFDATPPGLVDGIATEDGVLDPDAVDEVAAELRALRDWRA